MHIKKHLSFTGLRKLLSKSFEQVPDSRQKGKVDYSIHDALMSGFACMYFQDPSLLQFQERMQVKQNRNNLATLFGVQDIPKDCQLRRIVDEVDSDNFGYFFEEYTRLLQRGKHLERYELLPRLHLVPLDATGYFSSSSICCPGCLTKKHKGTEDEVEKTSADEEDNEELTYMHKALQLAIVHPDKRQVIPLMPEEIVNTDGGTKQDCEVNAAKRAMKKLYSAHPRLGIILLGDDVYSRQPMIEEATTHRFHYLFVCKPSSHKYLQEWIDAYKEGLPSCERINLKGEKYVMEWINNVPLHGGKDAINVNYLNCKVYRKDKKTGVEELTYHNTWVSDLEINKGNAYQLARGARCRWYIENECFNTLKNHGYNIERNYGHGERHLCFNFYLLTLIAFTFHQIFELTDRLYQLCRSAHCSKRHMWEELRSYIKKFVFESWESLLQFTINSEPYIQLIKPPPILSG